MSRWLIAFLVVLTGLRLALGAAMEVSPDEAYYYQWSQRLDWAYYSKGPGVALAIRAGTALLGPTAAGVRLLSPFLALGTSLVLFGMARRLYGTSVATWAVLMLNLTPIFNVGSLLMTIDALSIFFWGAALWAFWAALERSPKFSWFWPLAGALMGLGFLAKYTNAMELLSVALVLGLTPKFRREFARPGFWVMLAVFALAVIPPVAWNAGHDWITLDHLRSRGGLDSKFSIHPEELLAYVGMHFGVYSPLVFGGMLVALWQGCRAMREDFRAKFLVLFALPLLVMYGVLSLKHAGEANWTAPAFVSLGILTVAFWHDLAQRSAGARRFVVGALALALAMSLVIVNTDAVRRLGVRWPYDNDPGARVRGWESVARSVDGLRHKLEAESGKPLFLIANKYQTASSLAFYLPEKRVDGPGHPPVYIPESQAIENQYSFWGRYDEMTEPMDIARAMVPKVEDPALRGTLEAAIKDLDVAPAGKKVDQEAMADRRRALIRAMLAVNPSLPLDEYASEDWGISLFQGRDALFVSDKSKHPPPAIRKGFERVELVATWKEERRGLPLRLIWVFACHNYHNLPI